MTAYIVTELLADLKDRFEKEAEKEIDAKDYCNGIAAGIHIAWMLVKELDLNTRKVDD